MGYFDKSLVSGEEIKYITKKSSIIFFFPILLTLLFMYLTPYFYSNPILNRVIWAPWLVVLVFWAYTWLEYSTSEFAITNKRLLMREGFFNKHVAEMRLNSISQVNVEQGIIGQICNFGTISINSFGASDVFTLIANPVRFQRAINEQIDQS